MAADVITYNAAPSIAHNYGSGNDYVPPNSAVLTTSDPASDAYTVIPSRLAATIVDAFGLCRLSVSGPPTQVAIAQAWSPRLDNDPGHIWLRGCVRRAFGAAG